MDIELNNKKENNIKTTIVSIANNALEYGLRAILPDFIEDDIIEIKDKFIEEGFTDGVQEVIDKLEDMGKSIVGIFTGEFETMEQAKRVIQKNGLLDGISDVIDIVLKKLLNKKKINKSTFNLIKTGKKEILSNIEKGIEEEYKETTYSLEKLNEYCNEWKEQYKKQNYEEMEKIMKKIKQQLSQKKIVEETINEARNLEKIQKFIKEKGNIENIGDLEKELLEKIK